MIGCDDDEMQKRELCQIEQTLDVSRIARVPGALDVARVGNDRPLSDNDSRSRVISGISDLTLA